MMLRSNAFEALRLTFGFRREDGAVEYQRHAPTGGNLGSPEAHVLVGEGVAGPVQAITSMTG